MKIGHISANTQYNFNKRVNNKNNIEKNLPQVSAVSFGNTSDNLKRVGLAGTAALMGLNLAGCSPQQANVPPSSSENIEESTQEKTADDVANAIDAAKEAGLSGKTDLADISLVSLPVTEFYFTNSDGVILLKPDKDVPTNESGAVIATITEKKLPLQSYLLTTSQKII